MIILEIILKILLYSLLLLLVLCLIVCLSSIVVKISFWDEKFTWSVRYFGFQILPFQKKEKKSRKKMTRKARKIQKKSKVGDADTQNRETEKEADIMQDQKPEMDFQKKSESEPTPEKKQNFRMDQMLKSLQKFVSAMDMAGSACAAVPGTFRSLAWAAKWCDIRTNITIGGEDAYECARNYGLMQAAIQNLLAQVGTKITVKRKEIRIFCDFTQDESSYYFKFSFQIHVGKTILAVIYFLLVYFWDKHKVKTAVSGEKL